jgi:acyl-CoA synthetase (AMP-forming)/AMP-acid ligase II
VARLIDQLAWSARTWPGEVAYVDLGNHDESMTFAQWWARSNHLGRRLVDAGVTTGDRVALHVDTDHPLQWLVAYPAIHLAGAVSVPTNTRLTPRELTTVWGHAEPVVVLTSSSLADRLAAARPDVSAIREVIELEGDTWDGITAHDGDDVVPLEPGTDDEDLADIMYTSGTTGLPKGIAVRHRNTHIIPNGEPPWTGNAWIHCSPMFTFAGLSFVFNPQKMGMRGLYLGRFDVDRWIDAVERHRPTAAFLVPAMVQLLLNSPRFAAAELTSLELVSIGSAPLPPTLHLGMADRLPNASVSNSYSMTEAGTAFTFLPKEEVHRRLGSVGIPLGTEIRIADDDGEPVPPNTMGEVLIKVGSHHREYYRDPAATEATWSGEWLRSGDLGELDDDGYLYIRGRKKDMIIRGGNNIACTDVESVLYEHPAVVEAAVVAVPHDVLGEDVGAAVVLKDGEDASVDELRAFCAERLSDYKVPRVIWFVDELPRNPTGKVLKHELVAPVL